MSAFTPVSRASSPEAAMHALLIFAARNDLRSIVDETDNDDPRIARIEQALAAYDALAADRTLRTNGPSTGINYQAEFEAALEARDEAGYLGTTPAETIRALSEELRDTRKPILPEDFSVKIVDGNTELTFCDGKYTFVLAEEGTDYLLEIKRYGKAWSTNIVGPGQIVFGRAIGCLAAIASDAFARSGAAVR